MTNEILENESVQHLQELMRAKLTAFVPHKEVTIDRNLEDWELYNAVVGTTLDKETYESFTKDMTSLIWLVGHLPGGKKLIGEATSNTNEPKIQIPEKASEMKIVSKKEILKTFDLPEDVKIDDEEDYNVGYVDGKIELLDILYENSEGSLITSNDVLDPSEGWIPIAICLCKPGELGDGEPGRYICLKFMDENNPEEGSTDANPTTSRWSLESYNVLCDKAFKYDDDKGINEGTKDYDGLHHTLKILQDWGDDSYKTWSSKDQTENPDRYANAHIYPPVSICWQYHTIGTKQGQWYFPSYGELNLYYNHMYDEKNEDGTTKLGLASRMSKIQEQYPENSIVYIKNMSCWSSTEKNANVAIYPFFFGSRIVSGESPKRQNHYRIPAMIQVYDDNGYPKLTK